MRLFKTFGHLLDKGYWFSDYRVSAFASQLTGGLNQIDYHGQQPGSHNAKIFQNDNGVVTFALERRSAGKVEEYRIEYDEIQVFPYGFVNSFSLPDFQVTLSMTIFRKSLFFRFEFENKSKRHLEAALKVRFNLNSCSTNVHGQRIWDKPRIMKDGSVQLRACDKILLKEWVEKKGDYLVNDLLREKIFKTTLTADGETLKELKPQYRKGGILLYDAEIFSIVGGDGFSVVQNSESWMEFQSTFMTPKPGSKSRSLVFVISFGDTLKEVTKDYKSLLRKARDVERRQIERYRILAKRVPKLSLEGNPEVEELFQITPQVVESAKIDEAGMTRACASSYYEVWGWDNLVTGMELAKWGDLGYLRKMVEFFRTHRAPGGGTPGRWTRQWESMDSPGMGGIDFLYVLLILELYNATQDRKILKRCYPTVKFVFDSLARHADDNGFFKTIGMYPDFPRRLGRNNHSYVAQDEGAWFCLARLVEMIAFVLGDSGTREKARRISDRIKENYLKTFFDGTQGFLYDSIDSRTCEPVEAYTLFTLLFLHNSVGFELLSECEERLGNIVQESFFQEHGVGMTPAWDRYRASEIALSSWYPHWDIYPVKLLRRLGDSETLLRWLTLVQDCYRRLGYCPELVSLKPEDIHPRKRWTHHGSPWNLNCATGWYKAIVEAIVGVESDIGGLTYIPCPFPFEIGLSRLHFRKTVWDIKIRGEGKYVQAFLVDGKKIEGTYKIPKRFYTPGSHRLEVQYGTQPSIPPIIREVRGGELLTVRSSDEHLEARINGFGTCSVLFGSSQRPDVVLDGKGILVKWNESRKIGSVEIPFPGEHLLALRF